MFVKMRAARGGGRVFFRSRRERFAAAGPENGTSWELASVLSDKNTQKNETGALAAASFSLSTAKNAAARPFAGLRMAGRGEERAVGADAQETTFSITLVWAKRLSMMPSERPSTGT